MGREREARMEDLRIWKDWGMGGREGEGGGAMVMGEKVRDFSSILGWLDFGLGEG